MTRARHARALACVFSSFVRSTRFAVAAAPPPPTRACAPGGRRAHRPREGRTRLARAHYAHPRARRARVHGRAVARAALRRARAVRAARSVTVSPRWHVRARYRARQVPYGLGRVGAQGGSVGVCRCCTPRHELCQPVFESRVNAAVLQRRAMRRRRARNCRNTRRPTNPPQDVLDTSTSLQQSPGPGAPRARAQSCASNAAQPPPWPHLRRSHARPLLGRCSYNFLLRETRAMQCPAHMIVGEGDGKGAKPDDMPAAQIPGHDGVVT